MRVRTSVEIEAPVERVWAVLADLERYPEWNPFTPRVEGTLAPGEKVRLTVRLGGGTRQRTHVVSRVEENRALGWTIRTRRPWLIRGERTQTLAALGPGRTRYDNDERVEGLVSPLVALGYRAAVARGLEAVSAALKARAEAPAGVW